MTERPGHKRRRTAWIVAAGALAVVVAITAVGALFFMRYVKTEHANAAAAAGEFKAVRTQLAGQVPLLELRGAEAPVFHRDRRSDRGIKALHALVYDPSEKSLRHFDVPVAALRVMSLGGYVRLLDFGLPGDARGRLTLADLEQHGPGLIVDAFGSEIAPLALGDAIVGGAKVSNAQLLMWTE